MSKHSAGWLIRSHSGSSAGAITLRSHWRRTASNLRLAGLVLTCLLAMPAAATDLNLLAGWQYNDDMAIGEAPAPGARDGTGDKVSMAGDAAFVAGVDFPLSGDPDARVGAMVSYSETRFGNSSGLDNRDMAVTHLHFTGTRYYPQGAWEPFVMAGVGAAFFDPEDNSLDSTTRLSGHIAGGTNFRLDEHLLLRLEARWLATFFDSGGSAICAGGCTVVFDSRAYSQVQVNVGLQFRF